MPDWFTIMLATCMAPPSLAARSILEWSTGSGRQVIIRCYTALMTNGDLFLMEESFGIGLGISTALLWSAEHSTREQYSSSRLQVNTPFSTPSAPLMGHN